MLHLSYFLLLSLLNSVKCVSIILKLPNKYNEKIVCFKKRNLSIPFLVFYNILLIVLLSLANSSSVNASPLTLAPFPRLSIALIITSFGR